MGWADNKYARASNLSSYLPVADGTLTAIFSFPVAQGLTATTAIRSCMTVVAELRATADKPLIFSSGSGANGLLSSRLRHRGNIQKQ